MKIVIIGGTGLIGSKVVSKLRQQGHEAVAASPDSGVNTITGEGLDNILAGATVVVDVSNSPSFEDAAVLKFFETSTGNILKAEAAAGVRHHVALSIVGAERLTDSGYMRAKMAQERLIVQSSIPYSIVHSTQFFEFVKSMGGGSKDDTTVSLPDVLIQPIAANDVANEVATVAVGPPINGIVEVAGPQQFRMDDLVRRVLSALGDSREVITDPNARYYGAKVDDRSLVAGDSATIGKIRFEDWFHDSVESKPKSPERAAEARSSTRSTTAPESSTQSPPPPGA